MRCGFANAAGLLVLAILVSGCKRAQPAAPLTVHLQSGDSVEILGWSAAVVPGEPQGLLLGYRPFTPMEDTVQLRRTAIALWHTYARAEAEQRRTTWIVLRAQSQPERGVGLPVATSFTYGVVLDRRADGNWYFHRSGLPVD
jgi:hypothetical protein